MKFASRVNVTFTALGLLAAVSVASAYYTMDIYNWGNNACTGKTMKVDMWLQSTPRGTTTYCVYGCYLPTYEGVKNDWFYRRDCTRDNNTQAVADALFGGAKYLIVVSYTDTLCNTLDSKAIAYLADGTCLPDTGSDSVGVKVKLASNGSATLEHFWDLACTNMSAVEAFPASSLVPNTCVAGLKLFTSTSAPTLEEKVIPLIAKQEAMVTGLKVNSRVNKARLDGLTTTQQSTNVSLTRVEELSTAQLDMKRGFLDIALDRATTCCAPTANASSWWRCSLKCAQAEAVTAAASNSP